MLWSQLILSKVEMEIFFKAYRSMATSVA